MVIETGTVLTTLAVAAALMKCVKEGIGLYKEWKNEKVAAPKVPSQASNNVAAQRMAAARVKTMA